MNPTELLSADLVRLAFVIGMVLSVLLYEKSHLTTGSIVVPGFFGIHIFEPTLIFISLLNASLCFGIVHRLGPKFWFLENKTKFYALIIVSVFLQLLWNQLATIQTPLSAFGNSMTGFGFVIPGLIAHDMARNGCLKTSLNTLLVSCIVGCMVFLLVVVSPRTSLNLQEVSRIPVSFDLAVVLALSTLGAIMLKLQTPIRSGGYITAAYFVFFGFDPLTLVLIIIAALATHLLCCRMLIPQLVVFGRRKFSLMLIVGAILMWGIGLLLAVARVEVQIINHPCYAGIVILLPGLIANSMQRTSIVSVGIGLGLLASWIFVIVTLFYEVKYFARPEHVFPLVGCLSGIFLVTIFLRRRNGLETSSPNPMFEHGATS